MAVTCSGPVAGIGRLTAMTTFRVWAPLGGSGTRPARDCRGARPRRDRRRLVGEPSPDAGTGHRLRLPARRRRAAPARPALALAAATACTGVSRVYDHAAYGWTGRRLARGAQLPGAVIYELHVGTFTPEGTFDAAIDRLDHLVDLGVDLVELMPVNAFDGGWQLGLRRRRSGTRCTSRYGGPDGLQALRRRLPRAAASRCVLDVVYNHLGPSGNYLAAVRALLQRRQRNTWGDVAEPRRRRLATRCAATSSTTR